jgi:hypothetical protein
MPGDGDGEVNNFQAAAFVVGALCTICLPAFWCLCRADKGAGLRRFDWWCAAAVVWFVVSVGFWAVALRR